MSVHIQTIRLLLYKGLQLTVKETLIVMSSYSNASISVRLYSEHFKGEICKLVYSKVGPNLKYHFAPDEAVANRCSVQSALTQTGEEEVALPRW